MNPSNPSAVGQLKHELEHMSGHWWWFILLGALLAVCGTAAIVRPPVLEATSIIVPVVLGVLLMVGGVATIISSFWAGKWSGFLVQLLVGILYLVVGLVFTENPFETALDHSRLVGSDRWSIPFSQWSNSRGLCASRGRTAWQSVANTGLA